MLVERTQMKTSNCSKCKEPKKLKFKFEEKYYKRFILCWKCYYKFRKKKSNPRQGPESGSAPVHYPQNRAA